MIEVEGISPDRTVRVPNGIPPFPPPSNRDVRGELGIASDVPIVGTVCALRPEKALDVLISAAEILVREFPGIRVLIAGHGEERRRLESLVDSRGLGATVIMLGRRRDVPDLLRAIDVAVNSSDLEASPLSVMEYMEAGKPVVATRVGGVPEMIEPGVQGLLVEPRDPVGMAGAIAELLRDPGLRARMGEHGRERRRREFDIDVTVRTIERLYEDLYAEASSSRGRRP
jgi:L-malate glycosyltransferase